MGYLDDVIVISDDDEGPSQPRRSKRLKTGALYFHQDLPPSLLLAVMHCWYRLRTSIVSMPRISMSWDLAFALLLPYLLAIYRAITVLQANLCDIPHALPVNALVS